MSGSKHPNWKGGVMKGRKDRNKAEYKNWRKDVFYRDNYTCQLCKKRGGYLEADHYPIPYSICEMIWGEGKYDIDNGRTLCKECHHGDKKNLHDSLFLFSCDFKQSQLESLLLHK